MWRPIWSVTDMKVVLVHSLQTLLAVPHHWSVSPTNIYHLKFVIIPYEFIFLKLLENFSFLIQTDRHLTQNCIIYTIRTVRKFDFFLFVLRNISRCDMKSLKIVQIMQFLKTENYFSTCKMVFKCNLFEHCHLAQKRIMKTSRHLFHTPRKRFFFSYSFL